MSWYSDRFHEFDIAVDGQCYKAVATNVYRFGVAVLICLFKDGQEVGSVKLVSDFPAAVVPWAFCTDQQVMKAACLQFQDNGLAKLALDFTCRPLPVFLDPRYLVL